MCSSKLLFGGGLLGFSLLSGAVLFAPIAKADTSGTVDVTVNVPAACTLTATNNNLVKTINPGTGDTIGTSNLKAICNDPDGFAVYAVGYTDNIYGKNVLSTELTNGEQNYDIISGTAESGNTSNWSMQLAAIAGDYTLTIENGFGNYSVIPTAYTKVASFDSNTDASIGGNFSATFKAYIAPSQAASTYQGKVKFTLVHPSTHDAPDRFYGVTMQTVAEWGGDVAQGQTVTAIDERDGEEYTIARLADGKLWMTKDLRLDFSKLTKSNQELDGLTNGSASGFFAAAKAADMSDPWCTSSDSNCINRVQYSTANINGESCPNGNCDEYGAYYNWYTATAGNGLYSMDSYANTQGDICPSGWHLPTGTNTNVGSPVVWSGDYWVLAAGLAGVNILNIQNSDHSNITSTTNRARFYTSPAYFKDAGYWAYNSVYFRNERAYYWSSTYYNEGSAYMLYLNNSDSYFSPGYSSQSKYLGLTVRCVANVVEEQLVLQEVSDWGENVYQGDVVAAVDIRDGQTYKVSRYADGRLWMSNLNLGATSLTEDLDSENTNLAPSTTISIETFNTWIKSRSSDSFTIPDVIPITAENSQTGSKTDSYGNNYGTLYNYAAASANTINMDSSSNQSDAVYDLCPYGWRLPTGGSGGEFESLTTVYNISNDATGVNRMQSELKFPTAGWAYSSLNTANGEGDYWASTRVSAYEMRKLQFGHGYVSPTSSNRRSYAMSVRCIAIQ